MKSSKKPWPLKSTHGIRDRVNTNPDFQRPSVWSNAQKQLLIDTILRDYDIPKLYWRKISTKPDKYDVIDGQQRLRAIWGFFNGDFPLPKNSDPIEGETVANLHYQDLPDDLRMRFDVYSLDVVVLEESDEDEVREMFLRLQNGTSLKAQEKRNAYPGQMRNFVRQLVSHPFFQSVGFANARFNHDLVAAQLVCLELAGGPTNIKNADLNRMYDAFVNFDGKSTEAKSVLRTLGILAEIFPEKTPELERFNVISLYCVISEMQRQYAFEQLRPLLHDWFLDFETKRRAMEQLPEEEIDPEWGSYKEKISHSTDSADSVRWRMEFMLRDFLETFPQTQRKDNQRGFTRSQRLAVFRRDKGVCQLKIKCDGAKLAWDDWHCDHTVPWTAGGKTTVENARVACTACNLAKGASMPQLYSTSELQSTATTKPSYDENPIVTLPTVQEIGLANHIDTTQNEHTSDIQRHPRKSITSTSKSARSGLIVKFRDGAVLAEKVAADTFAKTLEKFGWERVIDLDLKVNYFPLVSKQQAPDPKRCNQTELGGYFIVTHSSTESKRKLLLRIADDLNEKISVDIATF